MARAERGAGARLPGAADAPTSSLFRFGVEDRVQCGETGRVRWGRQRGAGPATCGAAAQVPASQPVRQQLAQDCVHAARPQAALPPHPHPPSPRQVAYRQGTAACLGLEIPLEAAENKKELAQYEVGGCSRGVRLCRTGACSQHA